MMKIMMMKKERRTGDVPMDHALAVQMKKTSSDVHGHPYQRPIAQHAQILILMMMMKKKEEVMRMRMMTMKECFCVTFWRMLSKLPFAQNADTKQKGCTRTDRTL